MTDQELETLRRYGVGSLPEFAADEIERLRACLKTANENHERFEREWYLRGDEIDRLRAENKELRLQAAIRPEVKMSECETYCETAKRLSARVVQLEAELASPRCPNCDCLRLALGESRRRVAELESALRSIAANTCCERCQEAALVARAALEPQP